jgi:hypothetical protein
MSLEINHSKRLLNDNGILQKNGYTNETIQKISFESKNTVLIQILKDYLETNYKMYQYKKDNGVKYGKEDLFYWCNYKDDMHKRYFDVTLNDNNPIEYNQNIVRKIEDYLMINYSNENLHVRYQYYDRINWDKINIIVKEYRLVLSDTSFNFKLLAVIWYHGRAVGGKLNKDNIDKLINIERQIQQYFKDKKIIFNGIKGTVKEISEGRFGVFKSHARRTYYSFELEKIEEIKIA